MAKLITIHGCDNPQQVGDVIFIHSLGGTGLESWHHDPSELKTARPQGQPIDPSQLNF